jgi:chromosomal replication initiator protein
MSMDRRELGSSAEDFSGEEHWDGRDEIEDLAAAVGSAGADEGRREPGAANAEELRNRSDAEIAKAGDAFEDEEPISGRRNGAERGGPITVAGDGALGPQSGRKVRAVLKARLGDDVYTSWFGALEFAELEGTVLKVTVPTKFLRNWISQHHTEALLAAAAIEFKGVTRVEVALRQPLVQGGRSAGVTSPAARGQAEHLGDGRRPAPRLPLATPAARILVNGLEGSPLDPRYTLESFAVGPANRMAHAGATQVAETVFADERGFNPFFIHSGVGHGKTHLLHAIAWEVKRRTPHAQVLYLTAERFRFQFVEAVKAQEAMAFKERFRSIDLLLIDDLEFLQGEKTELEFDHVINMLLDGGRQLVVASARPPSQLVRLNDRMRSRLGRGLVTEIGALDYDLRLRILERRITDKRSVNPSFEIPREGVELLASSLKESGRELEGAVTRLFATWQYMGTPITIDVVNGVIGELVNGAEPRRIRIEDILRIISRHYGVSRADILSQRRHRSVVWPRQIGMYLAKQLTSRSLPEIGRRFGGRDHTTVLHAIRKVDGELTGNNRLKDELEELKKQLSISG